MRMIKPLRASVIITLANSGMIRPVIINVMVSVLTKVPKCANPMLKATSSRIKLVKR